MTSPIDGLVTELRKDGIEGIKNLIARKEQEQFFIDFKNFSIRDYSGKKTLEDSDRKNFSKAISGFGNSEGGVLIWGISGKDHAEMLDPINGYETFLNLVNSFVSRSTIPAHTSVENFSIPSDGETGFVVTIIPKSDNTPHRTIDGQKEGQYYMRAGDSFLPVPHSVLAGMFGRRPSPKISFIFESPTPKTLVNRKVVIEKIVTLKNIGLGIAKHIYCQIFASKFPNSIEETELFKFIGDERYFSHSYNFSRQIQCASISDFVLAPGQFYKTILLTLTLAPPFDNDLELSIGYGCEGSEPGSFKLQYSKESLLKIYNSIISGVSGKELTDLLKNERY